jgi:hypothetical protein
LSPALRSVHPPTSMSKTFFCCKTVISGAGITSHIVRRFHSFAISTLATISSALVGGEWSASRPGRFTLGERAPGTHCIGSWVGPRDGLDDVEKRKFLTLPGLELRTLAHPAHIQSLYRLRYHGSYYLR